LYPPSTERALAAQGEFAFCSEEFTIDEWNYFRTEGDGAEVKPMDPVSAERTDEMVAALGGDRSKKISHREYNRLMGSHLDHRQIEQLMLREIR
jgi:hypothetical protein